MMGALLLKGLSWLKHEKHIHCNLITVLNTTSRPALLHRLTRLLGINWTRLVMSITEYESILRQRTIIVKQSLKVPSSS